MDVVLTLDFVAEFGNQRRQFGHGQSLAPGAAEVLGRGYDVKIEVHQRLGCIHRRLPLRRVTADNVVRILAHGHCRDRQIGGQPVFETHAARCNNRLAHACERLACLVQPPDRRLLAGGVGVQRQYEVVSVALQLSQLLGVNAVPMHATTF